MNTPNDKVTCAICGHTDDVWLGEHIAEHGLTLRQYEAQHGPGVSQGLHLSLEQERSHPPEKIMMEFAGVKAPVNLDVPASACLPLPDAYRIPEHGELARDVQEAVVSLLHGRSIYVWGLPGSGKDALFHAWSSVTRKPAAIFQIEPGEDIRAWFFSHELGSEGSYWQEGELLKILRDGYTSPTTGRKIPMLVLITDFDRATGDQAESMRLVMDSISGRVKGPGGVTYPVLPGTQIVVTANSAGGGDTRGRCVTSKPVDASILDRFQRAYEFHWMDWRDEEPIVKAKFPILNALAPNVFGSAGKVVASLREAIAKEEIYTEFSHRAVCAWLGHAQDLIETIGPMGNLLERSYRTVLDKMPDRETRDQAKRIADPFLLGGTMGSAPRSAPRSATR